MKQISRTAEDILAQMRTYFQENANKRIYTNEEPLRSELFTSGQMEKYGKTLAETHRLSSEKAKTLYYVVWLIMKNIIRSSDIAYRR